MQQIPYIVINKRLHSDGDLMTHIDYESASEDKLYTTLLKEFHFCMLYHDFHYNFEEKLFEIEDLDVDDVDVEVEAEALDVDVEDLECDECGCRVVSKEYITAVDSSKFCGACSPSTCPSPSDASIDKKIFAEFRRFLDKKGRKCDILYFNSNEWKRFTIE